MTIAELGPWLSLAGVIGAALIAWWTKRTPERQDTSAVMRDDMDRLVNRIESLEQSNATQWATIQELRGRVDSLWSLLGRLKGYVRSLEDKIRDLTGAPHQRPPDIEDIFNH